MKVTGEKGLTILELVLAMTMFSVIILGSTKLESSVVQLASDGMEVSQKQNSLFRAFRILDKDLGRAETLTILNLPDPEASKVNHFYRWKIHPTRMGGDVSEDITYEIDLQGETSLFTRKVGDRKTRNLVSPGKLKLGKLKDSGEKKAEMAVWLTDGFKVMTINLGLKGKAQMKKGLPVFARSFWIRSAKVIDSRGNG